MPPPHPTRDEDSPYAPAATTTEGPEGTIASGYDDGAVISSLVFLALTFIFWFASKPLVQWSAKYATRKRHKKKNAHKHHKHDHKEKFHKDNSRAETKDLIFGGVLPLEDLTSAAAQSLPLPLRWILSCACFNAAVQCWSSQWNPDSPQNQAAELLCMLLVCVIIYKCNQVAKCFVDLLKIYLLAKAELTQGKLDDMIVPIIVQLLRRFLDVIFVAFGLENIGVNTTTLIASVSVTGVALAFAAKDYVAGLFGLLVIFTSHPFEVGDQIEIDGVRGVVKEVSLRYTCIVARYTGEHELVPNSHFLLGGLINISRRNSIRMSLRWAICCTDDDPHAQEDKKLVKISVIERIQMLREELLHTLDTDHEFVHGLSEVRVQMPDCRAGKAYSEIPRGLEIRLHGSFTADPSDWGRFCAREADYVLLVTTLMAKHNLRFAQPKTHRSLPDGTDDALPHCMIRNDLEGVNSSSGSPSLPFQSPGLPFSSPSPGISKTAPRKVSFTESNDSEPSSPNNSKGFEALRTGSPPALSRQPVSLEESAGISWPQNQRSETIMEDEELINIVSSMSMQIRSLSGRMVKMEQILNKIFPTAPSRTTISSQPGLLLCAGPNGSRNS